MDHLRGAKQFEAKSHRVHYSAVTQAELFSGNTAADLVNVLLALFREIDVSRTVAERAGRLRREVGVRLPDALIAAIAIEYKLGLFTRNVADFDKFRGLRIRAIG